MKYIKEYEEFVYETDYDYFYNSQDNDEDIDNSKEDLLDDMKNWDDKEIRKLSIEAYYKSFKVYSLNQDVDRLLKNFVDVYSMFIRRCFKEERKIDYNRDINFFRKYKDRLNDMIKKSLEKDINKLFADKKYDIGVYYRKFVNKKLYNKYEHLFNADDFGMLDN